MSEQVKGPLVLGALVCLGLLGMGYLLGSSAIRFKEYERFVTVKGLAEREVAADVVVWPIRFSGADQGFHPGTATEPRPTWKPWSGGCTPTAGSGGSRSRS